MTRSPIELSWTAKNVVDLLSSVYEQLNFDNLRHLMLCDGKLTSYAEDICHRTVKLIEDANCQEIRNDGILQNSQKLSQHQHQHQVQISCRQLGNAT